MWSEAVQYASQSGEMFYLFGGFLCIKGHFTDYLQGI